MPLHHVCTLVDILKERHWVPCCFCAINLGQSMLVHNPSRHLSMLLSLPRGSVRVLPLLAGFDNRQRTTLDSL